MSTDAMTDMRATAIAPSEGWTKRFSVVTLVGNRDKYDRMLRSFEARGFTPEVAEFIYADNSEGNRYDGFSGIRAAMANCNGRFVLYVHDDVELIEDDAERLWQLLVDLTDADPDWMVAGNSGVPVDAYGPRELARHLEDPHGAFRLANGPRRVLSLDENFLVLRRDKLVLPSIDVQGFHLFGADLCLHARLLGGSAYVIPFFLRHYSGGNPGKAWYDVRDALEAKYRPFFLDVRIPGPAGRLFLGRLGGVQRRIDTVRMWVERKIRRQMQRFGATPSEKQVRRS